MVTNHVAREFLVNSVTRASRAKLPPSPWLSARMTMATYFRVTNAMMVQKIRDNTPRMLAGSTAMGWCPAKVSLSAYSGLVPISPKTTPIAPTISAEGRLVFSSADIVLPSRFVVVRISACSSSIAGTDDDAMHHKLRLKQNN